MNLRIFTIDDYDDALALWQSSPEGIGIGRSDTRAEIEKKLERDPDLFLVAEAEGRLVGTVIGGFDGRRGLIYHLAVASDLRGQGLARRLMEEVERRLAAKGCLRAYLLVKPENASVIEMYQKLGWDTMDLTIMGKNLTNSYG